ncbi:unnamed protein product [Calypogeia fissa]
MGTIEDFRQFMACVISLEDMQKLSSQSLVDFQQNLEVFRREPLQGKSGLIAKLLEVAPSARFTRYLEAGGLHEDAARHNVVKLDSALKGLRTHIKKAQALLVELEILVKKNTDMMLSALCMNLENVEISAFGIEDEEGYEAHQQSAELRCVQRIPQTSDYVHIMTLILAMLEEDFKMQEKIVNALELDTKMEALQSYSLMWTLRPYVNDSVIEQALSWI